MDTEDLFCQSPIPDNESFYDQDIYQDADIEELGIKMHETDLARKEQEDETMDEVQEQVYSEPDKETDHSITIEDTQANDDDTMDHNNESGNHYDIYPVDHEKAHFDFLFTHFVNPATPVVSTEDTRESEVDRTTFWKNTTTGSSVPFMIPASATPNSDDQEQSETVIPPFNFTQANPTYLYTPNKEKAIKENFERLQEQVNVHPPSSSIENGKKEDSIMNNRTIKPLKKRTPQLSINSLSPYAFSPTKPPFLTLHQPFSFDIPPLDNSDEDEQTEEADPSVIRRSLAECFAFAPTIDNEFLQSDPVDDNEHGLATLLYELERICPVASEWYQLTKLNLSRQNLISICNLDKHFPYLETLQISHNQLKTISGLPSSLIYLHASHNKLSDVDIYELDRLQHLDVSNNSITAFEDMSRLKSLRKLDASHNVITSCKSFQNLSGLLSLSLKANCLRRLINFEAVIENNQLESLDVSFNRIEYLSAVENLKQLRELNADHNDIQYVQLTKPMKRLCRLQLCFNRLKSFDMSLFPDLRVLYLDDNQIQRIIGMSSVTPLGSFSIRDQGREAIEFNLQCLRASQKLYLSGNPSPNLNHLVDFYSLQYLELCSAGLEQLPSDFSKYVPNLTTLNLSLNRLENIWPLRKLRYLKRLMLIQNRLISLNEVIRVVQCMRQLHYLDLRQNPMSSNIYPPLNTTHILQQHNQEIVSPYVALVQDEGWVLKDLMFYENLSDHWRTRRQVYRALFMHKCPRLIELDQIKIEPTDRSEGDIVIDNFRRTQTPHTLSSNKSFSYQR
ncbi:hypothetical protein EDC96DRAFT_499992 [Choanephora cucurbitarum]|nr:hypothetical protein EDC96DRAFT_499992 [Choanephora cucurbitarum]